MNGLKSSLCVTAHSVSFSCWVYIIIPCIVRTFYICETHGAISIMSMRLSLPCATSIVSTRCGIHDTIIFQNMKLGLLCTTSVVSMRCDVHGTTGVVESMRCCVPGTIIIESTRRGVAWAISTESMTMRPTRWNIHTFMNTRIWKHIFINRDTRQHPVISWKVKSWALFTMDTHEMLLEMGWLWESRITLKTLEGLEARMCQFMPLQIPRLRKCCWTNLTAVGLLRAVGFLHVGLKQREFGEGSVALQAQERHLLLWMHFIMPLQSAQACKLCTAKLTNKGHGSCVSQQVLLQVAGLSEGSVTLVTLVRLLAAVCAAVNTQVGRAAEGHATH